MDEFVGTLVVAALIGLIPAKIASDKGHDFGAWWAYGFLIFIAALPHSLLLKPNRQGIESRLLAAGDKKCPHCAEVIKREALVCRYCGRDVSAGTPAAPPEAVNPADDALMELRWQYEAWVAAPAGPLRAEILATLAAIENLISGADSAARWRIARQIRGEFPRILDDADLEAAVLRVEGYAAAGSA